MKASSLDQKESDMLTVKGDPLGVKELHTQIGLVKTMLIFLI